MTDPTRPTADDRFVVMAAVFGFSLALGIATVMVPLLALDAGYDAASVGLLAATAAATQLGTRLALPWLLGRIRDRVLMTGAAMLMFAAFGLLLASRDLPVFAIAQVLQGAARAVFWTSSQTHIVRGPGRSVRRLIDLNVAGNVGTLTGPALGGMLALLGLPVALVAGLGGTVLAAVASWRLLSFEPFDRRGSAGTLAMLRRPGVDLACWASVMGGVWWSMLGSFVPVILVGAGIGSGGIGWLITASEAAGTAALVALRGVRSRRVARVVAVASTVVGGALVLLALAPSSVVAYALLLVLGGAASGAVVTLSPALASLASSPEEQGDAMALSGTFRAGALFGGPAVVGALVGGLAIGPAVALVAGITLAPGLAVAARARRIGGPSGPSGPV
jgi:MFS family permease